MSSSDRTPELTTVQHVVLCCLAWRGPQTPYQLEDYVTRIIAWLWDFPHTQLYTEPPKLAAMGLVTEEVEQAGRRRKTYAITPAGEEVVRGWLATPPEKPPELRDLALLKLHFSGLSTPDAVAALARHQLDVQRARQERLEELLRLGDDDRSRRRFIRSGARFGLEHVRDAVRFWNDVARDPGRRAEARATGIESPPWRGR